MSPKCYTTRRSTPTTQVVSYNSAQGECRTESDGSSNGQTCPMCHSHSPFHHKQQLEGDYIHAQLQWPWRLLQGVQQSVTNNMPAKVSADTRSHKHAGNNITGCFADGHSCPWCFLSSTQHKQTLHTKQHTH